jgi:phage terminase large subunit
MNPTPEAKRRRPGRPKAPTFGEAAFAFIRERAAQESVLSFPCTRYQADIIGFARDVLGFTPCRTLTELVDIRDDEDARGVPEHERLPCLWPKQIEILEAFMPADARVSVASGHKISKSHTFAIVALWFYSCFQDAKVVFTSTTYHQVEKILWTEFRKMRYRSAVLIPGEMHEVAHSGFKSDDFREVYGFTSKQPEAVAGISGKNLLFLVDEASGVDDAIFEAIQGNRAGGARIGMMSNPTKTTGTFAESHDAKAEFHTCFQVSSEETPNVVTGRRLIPGLATREYVEECKKEWGEDSAFYKIRIKGQFVRNDDSKPFSIERITNAQELWHVLGNEGRLQIGIDPAGPGKNGDESGFAIRRGRKIIKVYTKKLTEEGHLDELLAILREHRGDREIGDDIMPIVKIDREGPIGFGVYARIKTHFELSTDLPIRVVGVRASDKAQRLPEQYAFVRDELWAGLAQFLKEGGALPTDKKLEKELNAVEWSTDIRNRLRATPKDDLRKILNRSPDRADACALAAWESAGYRDDINVPPAAAPPPARTVPALDPYRASATSSTSSLDPYAGMR